MRTLRLAVPIALALLSAVACSKAYQDADYGKSPGDDASTDPASDANANADADANTNGDANGGGTADGAGTGDAGPDGASALTDSGNDAGLDATAIADTDDAAPQATIVLPGSWSSPNGAIFAVADAGTMVTGAGPAPDGDHAILLSTVTLTAATTDYTLVAHVLSPSTIATKEFGIIGGDSGGNSVLFGTAFGGGAVPYLATVSPPAWNPGSDVVTGGAYSYRGATFFTLVLRMVGTVAHGKLWLDGDPEPKAWQVVLDVKMPSVAPLKFGFFDYLAGGAVLEKLTVTHP